MAETSNDRPGQGFCESSRNEIDLIDLLLVLWSWRKLALVVFFIVFALGGALSIKMSMKQDIPPQSYVYSSALQVGWPDTSLPTAKWLLENKYVPKALADYVLQHSDMKKKLSISVAVPPGSSLIVLEGEGLEGERGAYSFVEQKALRSLISDNQSLPEDSQFRLVLREVGEQVGKIEPSSQKHRPVGVLLVISVIIAIFSSLISVIVAGLVLQVRKRLRGVGSV